MNNEIVTEIGQISNTIEALWRRVCELEKAATAKLLEETRAAIEAEKKVMSEKAAAASIHAAPAAPYRKIKASTFSLGYLEERARDDVPEPCDISIDEIVVEATRRLFVICNDDYVPVVDMRKSLLAALGKHVLDAHSGVRRGARRATFVYTYPSFDDDLVALVGYPPRNAEQRVPEQLELLGAKPANG